MLKGIHKRIALVTVLAFILQVMLPFFASYSTTYSGSATAQETSSLFGDKILVCTQDGFKWVRLSDTGSDDTSDTPAHTDYSCPLCYFAAEKPACDAPTDPHKVTYGDKHTPVYDRPYHDIGDTQYLAHHTHSRAPPHLASHH